MRISRIVKPSAKEVVADKKGFTLVEIVVVIALFGLTGLIMANIFVGHNSLFSFYNVEVANGRDTRLAVDRIVALTREAEGVLDSHNFSGSTYTTDNETLVLRLKTVNSSNDIITGSFDYIAFYRDASDPRLLKELVESSAGSRRPSRERILTDSTIALGFTYDTATPDQARTVGVQLATSKNFRNASSTARLAGEARLRNKN